MSKLNRKLPLAACAVAASAGLTLGVAPTASATTIGSTYTPFSISCNANTGLISQNEDQAYGVTVTHGLSGSNNSFAVGFDSSTVPTGAFGYTVSSLTNIKIRVQIDGGTYVSHSLSGGSGYTGTATATKTTSAPSGYDIIEIVIPSVAAGATFAPPILTIIQGSTVAPKLSTANGGNGTAATQDEGKYGYSAGNFYSFVSNARSIFGPVTANTTCLPTDVQFPSVGAYPVLNAGAGLLHP